MITIEKAYALRALIEKASAYLSEEDALNGIELFPVWSADNTYTVDDRVQYNGTLYKVLQDHTSQADWTPDSASSLFAEILAGQEGTEIGEWVQPDSTNPYMTGDKVIYNGVIYQSLIDNNVWSPDAYPAGWEEVTS